MSDIHQELELLRRENAELKSRLKSMEDAHRAFYDAFALSPNAELIATSPDFTIVDVNDAFTKLTGLKKDQTVGRQAFELGIFADPDHVRDHHAAQFLGDHWIARVPIDIVRPFKVPTQIRECLVSARATEIGGKPHVIAVLEDVTERNIIDGALRESQETFFYAFEVNPGAMVISDVDAGVVFIAVNQAFERLTGYSRDDVLGHKALDIQAFAFPEELAHVMDILRFHGEIRNFEFTFRRKDGSHGTGLYSATLVNINGRACSVATTLDITERKKTEAALRESEEKFAKAFKYNPGVMTMSRVDGVKNSFIAVNDTFEKATGFSRCDVIGRNAVEVGLISESDMNYIFTKIGEDGFVKDYDLTFHTKDGQTRFGLYSSIMVNINGMPCNIGTTYDVTERLQIDAELRKERRRLLDIIEATNAGTWEWNVQTGDTVFNERWANMLGYTLEELQPTTLQTWVNLLHPEDLPHTIEEINCHFEGKTPHYSVESRVRRKDGSWMWILDQGTLLSRTETGAPLMMYGTHTDIDERKNAESERARLEAQLQHARKMEAIGTLAGGIAHDFNNLLGGVLSGLSLLELELTAPQHRAEIDDMKALVKRGSDLTKQLLGFSRRGKYDIRCLDLAEVTKKTISMFARTRKDLLIQKSFALNLYAVLMDHAQLEQVLLNLFLNAAQAMPEGGLLRVDAQNVTVPAVEATTHRVHPGEYVRLEVEDTGTGMDAETLSRIFEPFFTTKTEENGSGLGLPSVYGIVQNHGGFIEVDSQLGRGTQFRIYLPRCDRPADKIPTPAPLPHAGSGTILIVDDEEALLKLYARMVKRLGYQAITASRGNEAIRILRENTDHITLVILDLTMPELSSTATFEALRDIAPDLKILLCSGHAVEGQAQTLLTRGANAFIQKPFDLQTLSETLRKLS